MTQQETEFNLDNLTKKPAVTQQVQAGPGIQGTFHGDPKDLANAHLEKDGIEQPLAPARPGGETPQQGGDTEFNLGNLTKKSPSVGSIGPEKHPFEARINSLMNDLKYGPGVNDNRLPERLLRFIGYQGTNKGTSGDPGAMMGGVGAVEGIPELIHAGSKIPQVNSWKGAQRVANEGMGGAFKTLAGAAPFIAPTSLVPGMAAGLPRYAAGSTAAKLFGGDPDTQEFVGDIAAAGTPLENAVGRKVGPVISRNAGRVGNAAGYGTALGRMGLDIARGKFPNPLDLLFASPAVTKPVTAMTRGVGNALSNMPPALVETPGKPQLPAETGPTTRDATTGRATTMPQGGQTIEGEPLINKDGEPITPPSPVKNGLFRLQGEQQPLEKFNETTDEILENLKAALQHVNESSPVDEKQSAELAQEIKEWEEYKDRVNQPDYENPYFNPREETAPLIESNNGQPPKGGGEVNYNPDEVTNRGLEQKAPSDELNEPLTNEGRSDIINNDMPKDISRRNFLKGAGKAAAGAMMPKGAAGKLIEGLTSENPIASNLRMNKNIANASMSPIMRAALSVFTGGGLDEESAAKHRDLVDPAREELMEMMQDAKDDAEEDGEKISDDEAARRAVENFLGNLSDDIHDSGEDEIYIKDLLGDIKGMSSDLKVLGHPWADPYEYLRDVVAPEDMIDQYPEHAERYKNDPRNEYNLSHPVDESRLHRQEEEPLIKSNRDLDEKALQVKLREDIEKKPKRGQLVETPWEHEPQEGESASLSAGNGQEGFKPFDPDELDLLYGKDVNDQLIQNKETKASTYDNSKRQFLLNQGYDDAEHMSDEEVQDALKDVVTRSQEKWQRLRDRNINPEPLINDLRSKFKQLGYADRDIEHLSQEQLEDLWQHIGNQAPKSVIDRTNDFLDQHTGFGEPWKDALSKVRDWAEMRGLHLTEKDNVRIRGMIGDGMTFDEIKKELLGDENTPF